MVLQMKTASAASGIICFRKFSYDSIDSTLQSLLFIYNHCTSCSAVDVHIVFVVFLGPNLLKYDYLYGNLVYRSAARYSFAAIQKILRPARKSLAEVVAAAAAEAPELDQGNVVYCKVS